MHTSLAMGQRAAQTLYYAFEMAKRVGLPFTHVVTINFAATKCAEVDACSAFAKLRRDLFGKWARRPNKGAGTAVEPTWAYAFENVRFEQAITEVGAADGHNVHVHWTVHIPSGRLKDFEHRLWGWVEKVTGGIEDASAIHIRPANEFTRPYMPKPVSRG